MKIESKILAGVVTLGLLLWIGDAAVDSLFFSGRPYLETLVLDVSPYEWYVRVTVLLACFAVGIISVVLLRRERGARRDLKESEERFSGFMRNLPGVAFVRDGEGRYLFVNDGWSKASGVPREKALGKTPEDLFPPEVAAEIREEDRKVLSGSDLYWDYYASGFGRTGAHWLSSKFSLPGGSPHGLVGGISVDVTEQVQAQRNLAEAEERYRTLVQNLGEGVGLVDLDEVFEYANPAAESIFGVSQGKLVGRSLSEFLSEEEFARAVCRTERRGRGESDSYECCITRADGEKRTLSVTASPRTDSKGNFLGTLAVFSDVTDLRRQEEALRQSEQRYRTILDEMEEGYYEVDLDGTLAFVNRSFCRILQRTQEEIVGRSYREFMHSAQAERTYRFFNAVFRTGQPTKTADWEMIRKDGARVAIEASVSPIRVSPTRWSGFRGMIRDVTEHRALEAERARLQNVEMVAKLSAGVAHEVRNPLFAIQVNLEALARKTALEPEERAHLDHVLNHVNRLGDLVRSLLELGQAVAPGELREMDLGGIVREACVMVSDGSPGARSRISFRDPARPATVLAERKKITLAFAHLLHNAVEASPEGGMIRIALDLSGGDGLVSVSDEGPGIPEEVRETLFEPFVTTRSGHSGLGLALARHYVQSHGGAVTAENNDPPPGATFTVRLPLASKETAEGPGDGRSET
jgi:two-component system cell cycle sensor histidine kinase/response regulator CckA